MMSRVPEGGASEVRSETIPCEDFREIEGEDAEILPPAIRDAERGE
jgi:hypothetical protein